MKLFHWQPEPDERNTRSTTTATNMSMSDLFGPVIYSYTRKQAIEDGVLVDLMQDEPP